MHFKIPTLFIINLLASGVTSHGWIKRLKLNGAAYTVFPEVKTPDWTAPAINITRQIGYDGPVLDILSTNITCNARAVPIADNGVSRTGTITAGSNFEIYWESWPHSGPIVTYMARCEPDCGSFLGSEGKVWFKIDEFGFEDSWATQKLYNQKYWWNVTVPECIPDGEYLIRHEIIALSECKTVGKCQFYPSCTQIKVIGGRDRGPAESELVSFPGAYGKTDKGILWDTNTQDPKDYVVPGPEVWKCPS
ncbi:lytic polysaccharide monooxygenase [Periconia macrospinosa]|uniref:AA9 family lytic polysaccharide monooxygenase n=1 Tax=Periconia macrospinosa TaxID=97972 RepID=A0A2V1DG97_9PLEO|nr:lytic polysaccharide monooxygenase [Periconia macrospinosa]